jgi:hypothetical protein
MAAPRVGRPARTRPTRGGTRIPRGPGGGILVGAGPSRLAAPLPTTAAGWCRCGPGVFARAKRRNPWAVQPGAVVHHDLVTDLRTPEPPGSESMGVIRSCTGSESTGVINSASPERAAVLWRRGGPRWPMTARFLPGRQTACQIGHVIDRGWDRRPGRKSPCHDGDAISTRRELIHC